MEKVLITGASGFLGPHVVSHLLRDGKHDLVLLGRNKSSYLNYPWFSEIEFLEGDVLKPLPQQLAGCFSSVIHLAWGGLPNYKCLSHLTREFPGHIRFLASLLEGGCSRILVSGTCLEFGMAEGGRYPHERVEPVTPYGQAKHFLHQSLLLLQKQHHYRLQWARLFYLWGQGQNPKSLMGSLQRVLDSGGGIFNMSAGDQVRDFISVELATEQLCDFFQSGTAGTINISSGKGVSVKDFVNEYLSFQNHSVSLNLGALPYTDYEPHSYWGVR